MSDEARGVGLLLRQIRAEERAFWTARGREDVVTIAPRGEVAVLQLLQDAPAEHCGVTPATAWCRYHVLLEATLYELRQGRAPDAG